MMNTQLLNGVKIDWEKIRSDSYLREIPAIKSAEYISFTHPVTFFAGENGSGKSTLLEAIAVAYGFNPEGGTRNYSFSTYDSHSELWCRLWIFPAGRELLQRGYEGGGVQQGTGRETAAFS